MVEFQVSLGTAHAAVLSIHGEVLTWGHGSGGRLGHGDEDDRLSPTVVRTLDSIDVVQVLVQYVLAALTPYSVAHSPALLLLKLRIRGAGHVWRASHCGAHR